MEFNSIPFINSVVTLYTLVLLYAPSFFLRIVLSPVLNSTGIILLFLLKLGANERLEKESNYLEVPRVLDHKDKHHEHLTLYSSFDLVSTSLEQRYLDLVDRNQTHPESHQNDSTLESNSHDDHHTWELQMVKKEEPRMDINSNQVDTPMKFLKWNMKAPLEIIYEAYEGEEEDDEDNNENDVVSSDKHATGLEALSMYYFDSDTDGVSDDDFMINGNQETHERVFLKWEDDDWEELIEISVESYDKRSIEFCHAEEDNLIEIDIFS